MTLLQPRSATFFGGRCQSAFPLAASSSSANQCHCTWPSRRLCTQWVFERFWTTSTWIATSPLYLWRAFGPQRMFLNITCISVSRAFDETVWSMHLVLFYLEAAHLTWDFRVSFIESSITHPVPSHALHASPSARPSGIDSRIERSFTTSSFIKPSKFTI